MTLAAPIEKYGLRKLAVVALVAFCVAAVGESCVASISPDTLAGKYVSNLDAGNWIILAADGTYQFHYSDRYDQEQTINGHWQLNRDGPQPVVVLDKYHPGTDPTLPWGSYPLTVKRTARETDLVVTPDASLFYAKQ